MHRCSNYNRKKDLAASERGREKAHARWAKDRERRDRLARATADQYPKQLLGRLVAVNEITGRAVEVPFFRWDHATEIRRKIRSATRAVFD